MLRGIQPEIRVIINGSCIKKGTAAGANRSPLLQGDTVKGQPTGMNTSRVIRPKGGGRRFGVSSAYRLIGYVTPGDRPNQAPRHYGTRRNPLNGEDD